MGRLLHEQHEQPETGKVFTFELDGKAENHMVDDRNLLTSFEEGAGSVCVGEGRQPTYKGFGTLKVFLKCEDDWTFVELTDVYYVPDIPINTLSKDRLKADIDDFTFGGEDKEYFLLQDFKAIAETFKTKNKKDGRTYHNAFGAFHTTDANFRGDKLLTTKEVADFLGKSVESLEKDDLGIE